MNRSNPTWDDFFSFFAATRALCGEVRGEWPVRSVNLIYMCMRCTYIFIYLSTTRRNRVAVTANKRQGTPGYLL